MKIKVEIELRDKDVKDLINELVEDLIFQLHTVSRK